MSGRMAWRIAVGVVVRVALTLLARNARRANEAIERAEKSSISIMGSRLPSTPFYDLRVIGQYVTPTSGFWHETRRWSDFEVARWVTRALLLGRAGSVNPFLIADNTFDGRTDVETEPMWPEDAHEGVGG